MKKAPPRCVSGRHGRYWACRRVQHSRFWACWIGQGDTRPTLSRRTSLISPQNSSPCLLIVGYLQALASCLAQGDGVCCGVGPTMRQGQQHLGYSQSLHYVADRSTQVDFGPLADLLADFQIRPLQISA